MATRKKSSRRSPGGVLAVLAILTALAAVLLWEIGCSRRTGTTGYSNPPASSVPAPHSQPQPSEPRGSASAQTEDDGESKGAGEELAEEPAAREEEPVPRESTDIAHEPEAAPDVSAPAPAAPPSEQLEPAQPALPPPAPSPKPRVSKSGPAVVYIRARPGSNRVAITFDAGSISQPTHKILAVLARYNLRVTFFLTGKFIQQNPDLTRAISVAGHEIGNHSYSHPRFVSLSDSKIAEQLSKTESLVQQTVGRSTKPLFRPPYGSYNKHVLEELGDNGYSAMIYWSLDSWDSVKPDITADYIKVRILKKVKDGDIILMHCGSQPTADALDEIIRVLISRGYSIVTVSELLGI